MIRLSLILMCILSGLPAFSQNLADDLLKGMDIRGIGPAAMSGRVTAIDVVRDQPQIIYAGTASGGIWKSISGGVSWEPVFDSAAVQSVGAIAIQQSNPDVIWAGTGEGNPRNSVSSGEGIYKSIDGGRSWKCMGLENTKAIHRIIINRHRPDEVYVAALGSPWGPNPERGVYRTVNGGESWERVLYVNDSTGCADLVTDPQNPDKLIAAMWEYGRKPWFFNSGGKGSGLYMSYDGGRSWKQLTEKDGLPKGELGRIGLAVAPGKPEVVYALIEAKKTGLYRSDDGGHSWKLRATENIGNRPFYYADIFVDPSNENRIYNLHSAVTMSEDGGKTFGPFMQWWDAHPDHHAWYVHPDDPDFLIDGNDGGMYISHNRGKTWQFAFNLPVGQFYHVNLDMETPYNVYGGMQDNGSHVGPAYVWKYGGIRNDEWQELSFGDGFDVVPQVGNSRYGYSMYQGGNVYRYDRETGYLQFVQPLHPEGIPLRFNWNAAIAADPHSDCGVYFGSQFLHYSSDCGQNWQIISPDLTSNDSTKQQQAKSGGLTLDATRAENYTTLTAIAPSPLDKKLIWVGSDDGKLHMTRSGGEKWEEISSRLPGFPEGAWINHIYASTISEGEVLISVNDYRRNNWQPYLYHSRDYGESWKRIAGPEQVKGHVWCAIQDPYEADLLFMGTERGLWYSIDRGAKWEQWTKDFPSVPVSDLAIHPREQDLVVATFGRALWVIDDIRPLRALAAGGGRMSEPLVLFEIPDAYSAVWRQPRGTRYPADAGYSGRNRRPGAMISYYLDPALLDSARKDTANPDDPFKGKLRVTVKDDKGDTLRFYTVMPDTLMQRMYWSLDANGIRFPSRRKADEHEPPGGGYLPPGRYKLSIALGDKVAGQTVVLKGDPRIESGKSGLEEKQAIQDEYAAVVQAAAEAFDRLRQAEDFLKLAGQYLGELEKDAAGPVKKGLSELQDSIGKLQDLYMTPQDFKGYDHVTQRINDKLYGVSGHMSFLPGKPTQMVRIALRDARKDVEAVLVRVNALFQHQWTDWTKALEDAGMRCPYEFEEIRIEE